jgi:hypothetical protein
MKRFWNYLLGIQEAESFPGEGCKTSIGTFLIGVEGLYFHLYSA